MTTEENADRGSWLGQLLQVLVLLSAMLVVATSVLAAVLGAVGLWRMWLALPLVLLAAVALGARLVLVPYARIPALPAAALGLVAAGTGWWLSATHSMQILPRRDSGSNLQAAILLADTGKRIVPVDVATVGGSRVLDLAGVSLGSPAFFEAGSSAHPVIQPQFVIGPAAVYSLGRWLGGIGTMVIQAPWLTAVGVLAVGLLVTVCVRPWWGVVAEIAVALSFPIVHTGRSTYSEPLAMVTLGAGLLALVLAARRDHARLALLAGSLIGGTLFTRIDGLREAMLLVPVAALASVQGQRWARPALFGLGASTLAGVVAAGALSYKYVGSILASLLPLVALGVLVCAASWLLVRLARRGRRLPSALTAQLPRILAAATILVGMLLASRPLWQTVRQNPDDSGAHVVAALQRAQGLRVDGGRTYAEQTVAWLSWWVGPIALIIALVALAGLMWTLGRDWSTSTLLPAWTGPLVVAAGSTALTLWRPGITPDHPWAERRLTIAMPLVAALCCAAGAWVGRRRPRLGALAAVAVVAALLVPTALATWPHRDERVEAGELGPVGQVCRSLHPGDVVLAADDRAANEWPQVVRGMCKFSSISTTISLRRDPVGFKAAVDTIESSLPAGSHLVLLAADGPEAITKLGREPTQVADAVVLEDARLLERRPDALVPLPIRVWLSKPANG